MYGGIHGQYVLSELWQYNISMNRWTQMVIQPGDVARAVVGHTAHVVDNIMYIFFGHSSIYGYVNSVQECNLGRFCIGVKSELAFLIHKCFMLKKKSN